MPPSHRHPAAGQGSLEYVGLLTLVSAVLAAAAPAVGVPAIGTQVVRIVRTGICIAGGDVCRASDAAAAGLAPCTLSDHKGGGGLTVTVLSMTLGGDSTWTVARRSDGSVAVTRSEGHRGGASGGYGFEAGPLRLGVWGELALTFVHATGWVFRDWATAGVFLSEVRHGAVDTDRWPPAWRSGDAGMDAGAGADAGAGHRLTDTHGVGIGMAGIESSTSSALGVRVGGGRTTYYFTTQATGLRASDGMGHSMGFGPGGLPAIVEYTRDAGGPRELAFRAVTNGPGSNQVTDTVARLDLRVPANRAIAGRLLAHRLPWPPELFGEVREVIRQTAAAGTVERSVYALHDRSRDLVLAGRLGLEVGVDVQRTSVDRRLVSATAMTQGSRPRERVDCLGAA